MAHHSSIAPEVLARLTTAAQALETALPPGARPSPSTLRRFAAEGRITQYRIGRNMLFDPEEVRALVQHIA